MKHATATAFWLKSVGCVCVVVLCFLSSSQAQAGLGQAVANSLQDHYNSYHDDTLFWRLPGTQAALGPGSLQKGCYHDNCCNGLEGCWLKPGQGQLEPGSLKKKSDKMF